MKIPAYTFSSNNWLRLNNAIPDNYIIYDGFYADGKYHVSGYADIYLNGRRVLDWRLYLKTKDDAFPKGVSSLY